MVWLRRSPKTEIARGKPHRLLNVYCCCFIVSHLVLQYRWQRGRHILPMLSAFQPSTDEKKFYKCIYTDADSLSIWLTVTAPTMQIHILLLLSLFPGAKTTTPTPCLSTHCNLMPSKAKYYFIMFSLSHHTAAKQQYALLRRCLPSEA